MIDEWQQLEARVWNSLSHMRQANKAYMHAVRYGKSAMFTHMYGGKLKENLVQTMTGRFTMGWSGGHPFARDASNGPFEVTLYNGNRSRMAGGKRAYKVVNKNNVRIFRGTLGACNHKRDELNLEHALWIMLKP